MTDSRDKATLLARPYAAGPAVVVGLALLVATAQAMAGLDEEVDRG